MSKLMELVGDLCNACHYRAIGVVAHGREEALAALESAVAELERDAARWEFIEKNCHAEYHPATCDYWRIASEFKSIDGELEGLAQAIDAAMEAGNVPER